MTKVGVICALVERTKDDFLSYYTDSERAERAAQILSWALSQDSRILSCEKELDSILPDTDEDGTWSASYALNTGVMLLCLISAMRGNPQDSYDEAAQAFFDTVDFKVQELLEQGGVSAPSEAQIAQHPLMRREKTWFATLSKQ